MKTQYTHIYYLAITVWGLHLWWLSGWRWLIPIACCVVLTTALSLWLLPSFRFTAMAFLVTCIAVSGWLAVHDQQRAETITELQSFDQWHFHVTLLTDMSRSQDGNRKPVSLYIHQAHSPRGGQRVAINAKALSWNAGGLRNLEYGQPALIRASWEEPSERQENLIHLTGIYEVQELTDWMPARQIALHAAHLGREKLRQATEHLPQDQAAIVRGSVIGDTSVMSPALETAMRTTSLTHITAVSGSHFAIVLVSLRLVCAMAGVPVTVRNLLSASCAIAMTFLVLPEPSVLRAMTMALIGVLVMELGRNVDVLSYLALTVILLLWWNPYLAGTYGFTLSVLATWVLLVFLPRVLAVTPRRWQIPAAVVAVPTLAQVIAFPVLVLLDPSWPSYGIVANTLVSPLVPVVTIAGLLAVLVPVPVVTQWLVTVAAWAGRALNAVALWLADLPLSQLPWLNGWAGFWAASLVSAVVLRVVHRVTESRLE